MNKDGKKKHEDVLSSSLSYIEEPKKKVGRLRRKATTTRPEISLLSDPSSFLQSPLESFTENGNNLINLLSDNDEVVAENEEDEEVDEEEEKDVLLFTKSHKKILLSDSDSANDSGEDSQNDEYFSNEDELQEVPSTSPSSKRISSIEPIKKLNLDLASIGLDSPFQNYSSNSIPSDLPYSISQRLLPHQVSGLNWLLEKHKDGRGAVLADDMGLGKVS